jgi:hypothetical protein
VNMLPGKITLFRKRWAVLTGSLLRQTSFVKLLVRPSSDKTHGIASVTRRGCGRVVHPHQLLS